MEIANAIIDKKQEETIINKIIEQANEKCKSIESIKDINEILKKYYVLEETLITQIKILGNESFLKDKIYNLLYENFFNENDINLYKQKCDYEKAVLNAFFDYYFGKDIIGDIRQIFLADEDKDFGIEKKEILYKIQKTLLLQAVIYVKNCINYKTISIFIFNSIRKLFIIKIEETLIQLYQFKVVTEPFITSSRFDYLKNQFTLIFQGKLEIFDKSIYNEEEKILFFKVFVISNWKYINNSEKNSKIFYNNLKKYITSIGLKEKFNDMVGECRKIIEVTDSEEIKSNLEKIKEEVLKNLSDEKFLFFILSFSIMLNSLSSILNKKKISEQTQFFPIPKLKCSSKERQFLIHLLLIFNAIKINYYLETLIYQQILKSYNKELYNSNFQRKEVIKFEQIIKDITSLTNRKNDNETSLNDLEINVISNYFGKFIKSKSGAFDNQDFPIQIFHKTKSIYSLIKYDVNQLSLYPLSHVKTSSQICILIDGTFTNIINLRHTLSCYLFQNMSSNCDFYTYKWQSINNLSDIDNNKKVAKFFGKMLAYIIISRTVFKFQCINIIGYSFGCHVIKHFLLELNKISGKIDTDDILNDVIFIGAATDLNMDKYPNILNNIGGRIVNVFSENDKELRDYNEDSMGLKMLVNNTPYKTSHSIININLSSKNIGQNDYFNEITRIINEKIKLF